MSEADAPAPAALPRKPRFGRTFWTLNVIEMWERLAYYSVKAVAPVYIMQADEGGGLQLSSLEKGVILGWWGALQSLLPIVTGGLADRFGYKRTLAFAVSLMMAGYLMMAFLRDLPWLSNYWAFFMSVLTLAAGTAFFKPSLQGSLAHQLTRANSSVGWGIFYWVVNVGAFLAHYVPTLLPLLYRWLPGPLQAARDTPEAWRNLFLASAAFTSLNLLLLLTFRDVPSGASKHEPVRRVLWRTFANILEPRLLCWMAIMSCFWLMMYQLWDLQPNFIKDWVDSGPVAQSLTWMPKDFYEVFVAQTPRGPMLHQQVLVSLNALCIILGVVGVAWMTRRMRTLSAMLIGMIAATAGILVAGWTQSVWALLAGIVCFSVGEMMASPKQNEYLGLIAPPDKKGLYLGYVNIPHGMGIFFGAQIAGYLYGRFGEKAVLALRYLAEHTPFGEGKDWDGDVGALEAALGVARTDAMQKLEAVTGLDSAAATRLLWETYSPQCVWIPFALIGAAAAVGLWLFNRRAKRWSDMNA